MPKKNRILRGQRWIATTLLRPNQRHGFVPSFTPIQVCQISHYRWGIDNLGGQEYN